MKKRGGILMYAIFLVSIAMMMAVVVLDFSTNIFNNTLYYSTLFGMQDKIEQKANLAFLYTRSMNSNGSGFIDNISCPTAVTMSGTTNKQVRTTAIQYAGSSPRCGGTYQSIAFFIYFNTSFTDFTRAVYSGSSVNLVAGVGVAPFAVPDATRISFSTAGLAGIDKLDDNFNSDDYDITSSGMVYPTSFMDDDANARSTIYGYIQTGSTSNIFWNNEKNGAFISANANNTGSLVKIANVSAGHLYLSVDTSFTLKLVKFNRASLSGTNDLQVVETFVSTQSGAIGYIQNTGVLSTGGLTKTGNEYIFDFSNDDYALFLSNMGTGTLSFQLKGYTSVGTGVYITPLDDSVAGTLRYLGSDIVFDGASRYAYKQYEVVSRK